MNLKFVKPYRTGMTNFGFGSLVMRAPKFWYPVQGRNEFPLSLLPWLLSPLAGAYLMGGRLRRKFARPYRAPIPVICIGNLVAGGTGKTPAALAIAKSLQAKGVNAHFLSRGYGGYHSGPLRVDAERHSAAEAGDEALLLAASAPTWIARDRKAGARAAAAAGADVLILDDGHQNPHLRKDLSLVLIDAAREFGNGWVIPAGPLRETLRAGLARADAVLIIGKGKVAGLPDELPLLQAFKQFRDAQDLTGRRLYAFCGIGAPGQFFDMLRAAGANVTGAEAFADHHPFTDQEIENILAQARQSGASAVTTEKDWVRLSPAFRKQIRPIRMEMVFSDMQALDRLLLAVLNRGP